MTIARITAASVVYHVTTRFVDREWFIQDHEERERYLQLLGRAVATSDWLCLAYALMSNHIHLALVAGESTLDSWIRRVHSPFATWMNARHHRLGPLFAHRPKSPAIQAHDEGRVIAYIHNNPVQAGVVRHARDSDWTSHRAYLGLAPAPSWLSCDQGLARSGFPGRRDAFDAWVDVHKEHAIPELELEPIRSASRRRGAIELATPTAGEHPMVPLVRRPFGHIRVDPRELVGVVASVLGLNALVMCSRRLAPRALDGRRLTVHVGKAMGLTGSDVAAVLGISQQAVSKMASSALEPRLTQARDFVLERLGVRVVRV